MYQDQNPLMLINDCSDNSSANVSTSGPENVAIGMDSEHQNKHECQPIVGNSLPEKTKLLMRESNQQFLLLCTSCHQVVESFEPSQQNEIQRSVAGWSVNGTSTYIWGG